MESEETFICSWLVRSTGNNSDVQLSPKRVGVGQLCGTETLICGTWHHQVDSIGIELNWRTRSWCHRIAWCGRERNPHIWCQNCRGCDNNMRTKATPRRSRVVFLPITISIYFFIETKMVGNLSIWGKAQNLNKVAMVKYIESKAK